MLTDEERRLVAENKGKEPTRLALSLRGSAAVRPAVVAQQVDAYNRLAQKVPSWAKIDGLEFPFPVAIQQCSSEPLARFRQHLSGEAASVIDLTGGLGVDCYFMGLGKESVTYVDSSPDAVESAKRNFSILGVNNTAFVNESAEDYVNRLIEAGAKVDLMFIDPSRRGAHGERVYKLQDCAPDVTKLAPLMEQVARCVMIKLSPLIDVSQAVSQLPDVTDVYAVGHGTECKDLLVCLTSEGCGQAGQPTIHAVTLDDSGLSCSHLSFTMAEERNAPCSIVTAMPAEGEFIFVPSAAMMKAGPFNVMAVRYGVKLLARNTHIYSSAHDVPGFPGRRFRIVGVFDMSKRGVADLRKITTSASVAVRNFPLTADALRRKLKMGESSEYFLFGVTGHDGHPLLLLCIKAK